MQKDSLEKLKKIPDIIEIERVNLTKEIEKTFHTKEHLKTATANKRALFVYKIIYQSEGHRVVGFIVEPRVPQKGRLPCIIWNRGGYGEKYAIKDKWLFYGTISEIARAGYIVITTQYSGNGGSEGVDEMGGSDVKDILNLHTILKKYPRADIGRIGMYGESRGGMMSYLALSKVTWIKAVVTVAGISNFLTRRGKKSFTLKEKRARSAILWVNKFPQKTPILLMHGTKDTSVSVLDSITLSKNLHDKKIPFSLHIFNGDDHFLSKNKAEKIKNTINWFDKHVKNYK